MNLSWWPPKIITDLPGSDLLCLRHLYKIEVKRKQRFRLEIDTLCIDNFEKGDYEIPSVHAFVDPCKVSDHYLINHLMDSAHIYIAASSKGPSEWISI